MSREYEYHLKVKPWVDNIYVFTTGGSVGMAKPAEDYEIVETDEKIFNVVFPIKVDTTSIQASFNFLAYGNGGVGEYKVSDLFSEPIEPTVSSTNVIVNTPDKIMSVFLEFPKEIQEALGVNQWIQLVRLDRNRFKKTNSFDNRDLMARGVDPDPEAINWISAIALHKQEWAYTRPIDFAKYLDDYKINVHCFEASFMQPIKIDVKPH
jgi:hypothetical protein